MCPIGFYRSRYDRSYILTHQPTHQSSLVKAGRRSSSSVATHIGRRGGGSTSYSVISINIGSGGSKSNLRENVYRLKVNGDTIPLVDRTFITCPYYDDYGRLRFSRQS